jgi:hypothetical protein
MSSISSTELFSVNYPMSITLIGGSETIVSSDAEFKQLLMLLLKLKLQWTKQKKIQKKWKRF